jgi:ABC-type glutathione transport system ATPase component
MSGVSVEGLRLADAEGRVLLDALSFELAPGERLAILGESGSGKTLTARALLGALPAGVGIIGGRVRVAGFDTLGERARDWPLQRPRCIALVGQDPSAALHPHFKIGAQLAELLTRVRGCAGSVAAARVDALLADVGLAQTLASALPHQLSGGQRQRAAIAMALALETPLLVCDEPTAALDPANAAQVLQLLLRLAAARGLSLVFVTHDLKLARRLCTRALVLKDGVGVDAGTIEGLAREARQPYTRELFDSLTLPTLRGSNVGEPLLTAQSLSAGWPRRGWQGWFRAPAPSLHALDLKLAAGAVIGLVGASGAGKSTAVRALGGLLQPLAGALTLHPAAGTRAQIVFQDPYRSLSPRQSIGAALDEVLAVHGMPQAARPARIGELLAAVGLDVRLASRLPRTLSGGQRQRVAIARALAVRSRVLIGDEALSALDARVQVTVLRLFAHLRDQLGLGLIHISHDLASIRALCNEVLVLDAGRVVERGPPEEVLVHPQHPATRALVAAERGLGGWLGAE